MSYYEIAISCIFNVLFTKKWQRWAQNKCRLGVVFPSQKYLCFWMLLCSCIRPRWSWKKRAIWLSIPQACGLDFSWCHLKSCWEGTPIGRSVPKAESIRLQVYATHIPYQRRAPDCGSSADECWAPQKRDLAVCMPGELEVKQECQAAAPYQYLGMGLNVNLNCTFLGDAEHCISLFR